MTVSILTGDCRDVVPTLQAGSIDCVVTDPPYALTANKKGGSGVASVNLASPYGRARIGTGNGSGGFMGKKWDTGETAFDAEFWAEVCRVLKPGAHLVAFGGTRSYHRLACAIEDAGFEVRDQIGWTYGSGFPKSHNAGNGWGTALKPAWEPIILARKPLIGTVAQNVQTHGTGALNIDGCRVEAASGDYDRPGNDLEHTRRGRADWRMPDQQAKPNPLGRWPANIVHDGSEEVLAAFPDAPGQQRATGPEFDRNANVYGKFAGVTPAEPRGDSGSAARFFYTAKADANDRIGSKHPTVKPVDLMRWLCRLVTPKGGTILDPFAGTGTTGEAAFYEGFNAILIEREAEYVADIERRMKLVMAGPDERAREIAKTKPELPLGGLFDASLSKATHGG